MSRAYCELDDLDPGEVVCVKVTGRGWDEPQWSPEVAVVDRARARDER